jgi:hypothetical protein
VRSRPATARAALAGLLVEAEFLALDARGLARGARRRRRGA